MLGIAEEYKGGVGVGSDLTSGLTRRGSRAFRDEVRCGTGRVLAFSRLAAVLARGAFSVLIPLAALEPLVEA